jgi:large subunit ribosomal protein L21
MYAVFEDGSRQYRVSEGQTVTVDFRGGDGGGADKGTQVEFKRVLLYCNGDDRRIGQPTVEGMRVVGEVVDHPSIKVMIQKFRRRKNVRRLRGHRQFYTAVRVKHILLPGQEIPAPAPAPTPESATPPAGQPAATTPTGTPAPAPTQPTPPATA